MSESEISSLSSQKSQVGLPKTGTRATSSLFIAGISGLIAGVATLVNRKKIKDE